MLIDVVYKKRAQTVGCARLFPCILTASRREQRRSAARPLREGLVSAAWSAMLIFPQLTASQRTKPASWRVVTIPWSRMYWLWVHHRHSWSSEWFHQLWPRRRVLPGLPATCAYWWRRATRPLSPLPSAQPHGPTPAGPGPTPPAVPQVPAQPRNKGKNLPVLGRRERCCCSEPAQWAQREAA